MSEGSIKFCRKQPATFNWIFILAADVSVGWWNHGRQWDRGRTNLWLTVSYQTTPLRANIHPFIRPSISSLAASYCTGGAEGLLSWCRSGFCPCGAVVEPLPAAFFSFFRKENEWKCCSSERLSLSHLLFTTLTSFCACKHLSCDTNLGSMCMDGFSLNGKHYLTNFTCILAYYRYLIFTQSFSYLLT